MHRLDPGSPLLACFAGATPLARGDAWGISATNDRAGVLQTLADRFFGLRAARVFLPSSATPTIADPA